jgi:MFS superfamily sulfate permease-like transporter
MDISTVAKFLRVRRSSFVLAMTATLGVVLFGVLEGILIAVALSILLFFKRNWWPTGQVLGRVDSLDSWHGIDAYPDAAQVPDVVVFRWEASLFFANASIFRQEIRRGQQRRCPLGGRPCEAINDIDVAAPTCSSVSTANSISAASICSWTAKSPVRPRNALRALGSLDRRHFYDSLTTPSPTSARRLNVVRIER